jgi:type IV secretory pathway VirJ component
LVPPEATVGRDLGERLTALVRAPLEAAETAPGLEDLPLVELPVDTAGSVMAVIYSGDGGWRDIDKDIAGYLQSKGVPVVGVDSLRYFWAEKKPDQTAKDLDRILEHYRAAWHRPDVLLIGYSFGADVLPFAYNRLPPAAKAAVRRLVLLGPSLSADFEIHVTGWLGLDSGPEAPPLAPELKRLDPGLVECVYGREEEDSGCTLPELAGATLVKTEGGHHFDGDYVTLAQDILAGAAAKKP